MCHGIVDSPTISGYSAINRSASTKIAKNRRPNFISPPQTRFADCQHLTGLDRLNLDEPMQKIPDEDHARLIQAKGIAHEEGFLRPVKFG